MNPFVVVILKYVMPVIVRIFSFFIPGRNGGVAVQEGKNKAWIMGLVVHVATVFPPKGSYKPLQELVKECYDLGLFPALWAVEGLGHYYSDTFPERNLPQQDILTDPSLDDIPSGSLTMLHAGIGLGFAKNSMEGLKPTSPTSDLRKAMEKFTGLCRQNSRPGYAGCALESLGIPGVILHGIPMVLALDQILMEIDPEAANYMWRGAGRAFYFHPKFFVPHWDCQWPGIKLSKEIAPHELARKNLRAGIAWATTVVNMRNPEIMEAVLLLQGENDPDHEMFINGMTSSMIMRYDTSPDDPYIMKFINHIPNPDNKRLCSLWQRDIKEPNLRAIREFHPLLLRKRKLEEVFHYQSLPELARRLQD